MILAMSMTQEPILQAGAPPAGDARTTTGPAVMDEAEFRELYARTARPLRAYLVNASGDRTLADDLLQESYYRYLRSGFRSDDADYRKNYLFRIATNLLRDHHRRKKPTVEILAGTSTSSGHSERINLRSDIARTLHQLKPRERQMLWLAYVEGSSHQEIAAVLGLQTASIRSMLFRARQHLAELLRKRGLAPDGIKEAAP